MTIARFAPGRAWLAAAAAAAIAALCADRLALIPVHVSFNPNEGWNAFQATRALGAGPLYPAPGALTGDNYPPLSFYLVGWTGRLVGDPIVAGRLVALASVLAVAACIFAAVRRVGGRAGPAEAIAALVFLGFNATQYRVYLAMDDPQWLAHALMAAGLLVILPARRDTAPSTPAAAGAAALMAAGGLVKHNLLAFPLAVTLWLALRHRRALVAWLGTAAAVLLAAAVLCEAAYGPAVFADILSGERRYSAVRMFSKSALPLLSSVPLIAVAAGLLKERRADPRCELLLLASSLGVVLGVLQRSGEGVNVNAHFEGLIVLCMAAGTALALAQGDAATSAFWRRSPVWLLAPLLVLLPVGARAEARAFAGEAFAQAAWSAMQQRIAAVPGRVACETPALCFWAGKGFELDMFLYGQHMLRRHDASALERALPAHRFAAVELDAPADRRVRRGDAPNPVLPLIEAHTRPVFTAADGRSLLAPTP